MTGSVVQLLNVVSHFLVDIEDWEEVQEEGDSPIAPKSIQNPRPADFKK